MSVALKYSLGATRNGAFLDSLFQDMEFAWRLRYALGDNNGFVCCTNVTIAS